MSDPAVLQRLEHLVDLRRYADARAGLASFLATEPENVDALLLFADVLDELDEPGPALDAALAAARLAPDVARVHRVCVHALLQNKRPEEAVRAAQEAIRLDPHHWHGHYALGRALLALRRPETRAALAAANEAVRLAPQVSHCHNLAGICLDALYMPAEAHRAFTEAVRLDPTNATALANLAGTHAERGKLRDASSFVTAGLSADAQQSHLHRQYDFILYRLMRRFFWTEIGCGVLVTILAGTGAPWITRALTGVALLGLLTWFGRDILRRLPRGSHAHARGLLRRSRGWMRYGIVLFLITTPAVVAMAFAPAHAALVIGLVTLELFRVLAVLVVVIGVGSAILGALPRRNRR